MICKALIRCMLETLLLPNSSKQQVKAKTRSNALPSSLMTTSQDGESWSGRCPFMLDLVGTEPPKSAWWSANMTSHQICGALAVLFMNYWDILSEMTRLLTRTFKKKDISLQGTHAFHWLLINPKRKLRMAKTALRRPELDSKTRWRPFCKA